MMANIVEATANGGKTLVLAAYVLIVADIGTFAASPVAAGEYAAPTDVAMAYDAEGGSKRTGQRELAIIVAEADSHGEGEHDTKKGKTPEAEPPVPPGADSEKMTPAEQYCAKVGDVAAKTQFVKQRKAFEQAQAGLDARIKSLNEKTEKLQSWIKKREDFLTSASDSLVEIYTKMKPEVAASQLVLMKATMAAAIVARLPPKAASAVLAEMDAPRAAQMSAVLAGVAELQDAKPAAEKKDKP